ncbi:MAG: cysteine desulfurase family protein [Janthinobacterium lividum]
MRHAPPTTCLDANASEPLRPEARAAVLRGLDLDGNPASVHAAGRAARRALEDARATIAHAFGVRPDGVVFTSGGTEADALAIAGLGAGRRVLAGATEHDAILQACPGAPRIPVHPDGRLDLDALDALLRDEPPALVCAMLANNETGVLHPVEAIAALCRRHGALLHVDAVQAAGRLPVNLATLGADSLAVSSHKLGGPKGAGALLLAPGIAPRPLIAGGGQERGRRGGTPALAPILGFAAACTPDAPRDPRIAAARDAIERAAAALGATVCAAAAPRLDNTACLAWPGLRAEMQVIALDLAGVQVSAGAACSSGKVARSHVLDAMGLGALSGEAIRVSVPWNADGTEPARFADAYAAMLRTARAA